MTEKYRDLYKREFNIYEFSCVQSSLYIRATREVVDNGTDKCMVFEWMDSDLWTLRGAKHELNPSILKITGTLVSCSRTYGRECPHTPACDVWSVGVSHLEHCLGLWTNILALHLCLFETSQAAWSIGKIIQLLGPLKRDEDPKSTQEFDLAEAVVEMGIIKMGSLEEELAKFDTPVDCVEFIRYLLTMAHEKRPTAEQALQHPWLQTA
ncbi:hypothetical protein AJ80_04782 [Polytolypa hystricis UAMH7299]|uniref:Protein kinase domain-containing protein n=1 Tax=Polytolypa hystricis (strain UAMH7299) TaxID=1447883 RepID=A0A2B7Y970_POLH7|nr:hypothetical protein AJ80_04782 [Polytolypa hystricis UAMH7299]